MRTFMGERYQMHSGSHTGMIFVPYLSHGVLQSTLFLELSIS